MRSTQNTAIRLSPLYRFHPLARNVIRSCDMSSHGSQASESKAVEGIHTPLLIDLSHQNTQYGHESQSSAILFRFGAACPGVRPELKGFKMDEPLNLLCSYCISCAFEQNLPFSLRCRAALLAMPSRFPDPEVAIKMSPEPSRRAMAVSFQVRATVVTRPSY